MINGIKRLTETALILFFACAASNAGDKHEKTGLKWLSFDAAKTLAAKGNKKIMVDVYTDWCKWCKKLDTVTYADAAVMKYLGEKYVVAKLNPEEDEHLTFKGKKMSNAE